MIEGQGFTRPPIWTMPRRGGLIVASEREYQGKRYFDIRQWANDATVPTKQGVTMPPEAVAELADALRAYADSLVGTGEAD